MDRKRIASIKYRLDENLDDLLEGLDQVSLFDKFGKIQNLLDNLFPDLNLLGDDNVARSLDGLMRAIAVKMKQIQKPSSSITRIPRTSKNIDQTRRI